MGVVIKNIPRVDPDTVAEFANFGVATVHEAQGCRGLMVPSMRPIYPGAHVAGTAVTVSVPPGDNWMIHVAAEQCSKGDIMVVAPTSSCSAGYFGDLLATLLMAREASALVIDGGVRDVAELTRMAFPVWSTSISAQGTVKETVGNVNTPIICAGALVNAGDVIVADDDGVVVVRGTEVDDVLEKSTRREAREAELRSRYAKGELGLDVHNMRARLAAKGLVYERKTDSDGSIPALGKK